MGRVRDRQEEWQWGEKVLEKAIEMAMAIAGKGQLAVQADIYNRILDGSI